MAVDIRNFNTDFGDFFIMRKKINEELKKNGTHDIEILLLYYSIPDTIDILLSKSLIFQYLCEDTKATEEFQKYFLYVKESYQRETYLSDRYTLYKLIEKSNIKAETIKTKSHLTFSQQPNREEYIKEILMRLKDCVNLYYSAYYNKKIEVELSNGQYLYLSFFEKNLPHLLGISKDQILSNPETKKILGIPHYQYPNEDVFDKNGRLLFTKKNNSISSIQILEKIISDLEGRQYIINAEFSKNVQKEQSHRKVLKLQREQFQFYTKRELLPFDKIDLKTRMFLSDSIYEKPSIFVNLAPGQKLTINNDLCDRIRISTSTFTAPKAPNKRGIVHHDYIFTGYGITSKKGGRVPISLILASRAESYGMKFQGQTPHSVISITSPINGNKTFFTPRQQVDMYFNLLHDFQSKNGMNLVALGEELKIFIEQYEQRIQKEMKKREKKMLSLKRNEEIKRK